MISGRGLGHTGGTLDKFDSIPGYNTQPNLDMFKKVVKEVGCAIIGQTSNLAPADKKLYSIRDIVGTVESLPLITSSILSKKIASGLKSLILDVKVGNGSFNSTIEISRELSQSLVSVAKGAGLKCEAIITDMNQVLGKSAGHTLEMLECIKYLKNEIKDDPKLPNLNISNCKINFKNINFTYNKTENTILSSINIEIKGGGMTALVGHSGAGKSTIMNLIPRFYDCDSGDILIDDQSIYKTNINSLRKNISLVSQETTLFDDTITNNIAYAKLDASESEIKKASEDSFASDFIEKLPNKYNTIIGENGVRLSGGEKQRLSIARAMLKKSPIILLDEATSSLDAETENKIQNALTQLTKNKTTIVIAHRLSTVLNADKIYVIDAGRIVDEGNHEFLLSNSNVYKNFYDKQIRKD